MWKFPLFKILDCKRVEPQNGGEFCYATFCIRCRILSAQGPELLTNQELQASDIMKKMGTSNTRHLLLRRQVNSLGPGLKFLDISSGSKLKWTWPLGTVWNPSVSRCGRLLFPLQHFRSRYILIHWSPRKPGT